MGSAGQHRRWLALLNEAMGFNEETKELALLGSGNLAISKACS